MGTRPTLPPESEVALEKARAAIFEAAPKNFNLLFHPILSGLNLFASVGMVLPSLSTLDVPVQRMRATLKQQLRDYSGSLFDAEAKERRKQATHTEELRLWLDDLAVDIEAEVTKIVAKEQLNVHCQIAERAQAVKDGLRDRIKYWVDLKAKEIQPVIPRALPLEARADWAARIVTAPSAIKPEQPTLATTSTNIGERLDEIVLEERNLSHEQLADRIGISRASYFQVKAGRAGPKSTRKVELYLSGLQTKNLDSKKD